MYSQKSHITSTTSGPWRFIAPLSGAAMMSGNHSLGGIRFGSTAGAIDLGFLTLGNRAKAAFP